MTSNKLQVVNSYLDQLSQDLSQAETKQEELEYLIELGQSLEVDRDLLSNKQCRVTGCASSTFIRLGKTDKNITFSSFTDSYVVKGYLVILSHCLNQLPVKDFDHAIKAIENFGQKNEFHVSHIPSRADAFSRIIETIKKQYESL